MDNTINAFQGRYRFLSNFAPTVMTIPIDRKDWSKGVIEVTNAEAAFHAYKCEGDAEAMQKFEGIPANEAKRKGRHVKMDVAAWDAKRLDVMRFVVHEKFRQNPTLKGMLIKTGSAKLIEGNTWNDTFWGVCGGIGKNNLGKILMKTRELAIKGEL